MHGFVLKSKGRLSIFKLKQFLYFGHACRNLHTKILRKDPKIVFYDLLETQPQLMLTGPMGFNNSGGSGAPYAAGSTGTGNSFPQGGMPPYQGYSM